MESIEIHRKLFDLQCLVDRKAELVLEIAQRYALDRRGDSSRDLSLHVRDEHRGHFNVEYDLRNQREYRDEMDALRSEHKEVSEQIKSLKSELEEVLGIPAVI